MDREMNGSVAGMLRSDGRAEHRGVTACQNREEISGDCGEKCKDTCNTDVDGIEFTCRICKQSFVAPWNLTLDAHNFVERAPCENIPGSQVRR